MLQRRLAQSLRPNCALALSIAFPGARNARYSGRSYATVSDSTTDCRKSSSLRSMLIDHHVLLAAKSKGRKMTISGIIQQYLEVSGTVLDIRLPDESRPSPGRRLAFGKDKEKVMNVLTVAHCAVVGGEHKITIASGFAVNVDRQKMGDEMAIVTCGHTLEEIRQWPLLLSSTDSEDASGSFVVIGGADSLEVYPVSRVLSALPRSDLLLISCPMPSGKLETLPVSPYPVNKGASIQVHFVSHQQPVELGWSPWIGDTWGKWAQGRVLGYRDFAGRKTEPGTYDSLSQLFFTPLPTPGSSGGPIVDEESGAVVGVTLGTRMDSRVEGVRGWGVPTETIFEMFSLPGLEGKK